MKIRLFVTGGTFDKEYNELTGNLFFKNSHVDEMLSLGRSLLEIKTETLMMIDSLEMTQLHRQEILQKCLECSETKIVITHGTDTMEQTAQWLGTQNIPKTIILTGAMVPYKFGSSDGLFNLGSALAFCQTLHHGVYVAMNGRYFLWDQVTKDRTTGVFRVK